MFKTILYVFGAGLLVMAVAFWGTGVVGIETAGVILWLLFWVILFGPAVAYTVFFALKAKDAGSKTIRMLGVPVVLFASYLVTMLVISVASIGYGTRLDDEHRARGGSGKGPCPAVVESLPGNILCSWQGRPKP